MRTIFENAYIQIENRKNGVEPAMFVIEDNTVYMITATVGDGNFSVSNEGKLGERYDFDENLQLIWVGNDTEPSADATSEKPSKLAKLSWEEKRTVLGATRLTAYRPSNENHGSYNTYIIGQLFNGKYIAFMVDACGKRRPAVSTKRHKRPTEYSNLRKLKRRIESGNQLWRVDDGQRAQPLIKEREG